MQRTMTAPRTGTIQAARYVSRRVLGDLLSIHEKFHMDTERRMRALAHDVEVGLAYDCLSALRLFLYPFGSNQLNRAYIYERVAAGSFASSPHSGRIARSSELIGGRIEYEVGLRDRLTWEALKLHDQLHLPWSACKGQSIAGMTATADGGYASGELGFSRTMYTR